MHYELRREGKKPVRYGPDYSAAFESGAIDTEAGYSQSVFNYAEKSGRKTAIYWLRLADARDPAGKPIGYLWAVGAGNHDLR